MFYTGSKNIHILFPSSVFLVFLIGLPLPSRLQKGLCEDFEIIILLKYHFMAVCLKNDSHVCSYSLVPVMLFIFRPGEECKEERARWDGAEVVASGNFWDLASPQDTKACYRVEIRNQKCSPHDGLC